MANSPENTAGLHAAGHVIVAAALGINLTHASRLTPPTTWLATPDAVPASDLGAILAAGPIAQTWRRDYPDQHKYCVSDFPVIADFAKDVALELGMETDVEGYAWCLSRACDQLAQHRNVCWDLATTLGQRDLTIDDLAKIHSDLAAAQHDTDRQHRLPTSRL